MLRDRDRAIIKDLNKFRVMDRNSVAELHFGDKKNPQHSANNVLLRLLRDGYIQRSTAFVPYLYFGPETQIKKNSQKIGHFLAILETYKEIRKHGRVETFLVEPKYGSKGTVEPDIYLKFRETGFFIEVQNSVYSEKQMKEKIDRYVEFQKTGIMSNPFPHVLILGEQRYALDEEYPFKIFQAESFSKFISNLRGDEVTPKVVQSTGIRIKIG